MSKISSTFTRAAVLATVLFLPLFAIHAQAADSKMPSLTERLQVLEDKEAIRQLLQHYIELNESRNWRDYSYLFADDGELVMGSGSFTGPDAIYNVLETNFGADKISKDSPLYGSSHVLSNVEINVTGDTATVVSRWTLLARGKDGNPIVNQHGKYRDRLVKVNGEWKFKQRVIETTIPAP